ncbi:MAG TPA: NTP transferase domain-containing protein [Candidatus Deferrimicrobiaceae bacterium]|nr:NTP transferase domain-containing protein [Candidatus Deferrimicrobiaceae bacterium]
MTDAQPRFAAVILAAGAGRRFGGAKLLARIDGAPILAHVVATARAAGLAPLLVAAGADLAEHAPALRIAPEELVVNPEPERGLSSSVRIGIAAATAAEPPVDGAVVLLGDQPLVRAAVIARLVAALEAAPTEVVAAVARYADGGSPNPVALRRAGFELAAEATGDRGLGPALEAHRGMVIEAEVPGGNPDVDRVDDLTAVAELAWAERVLANREQVERLREVADGPDFYATVSSIFRDDPDRTGDVVLDALRAMARPTDTWLDIGAGAGRYALPLARAVREVITLDPSPAMLAALREGMAEGGIENVRRVEGRWPDALELLGAPPVADVSLIAHVSYDVEAIWPFVDAMERATRRTCLAVLMERSPASLAEAFWPPVHGEPRIALPGLPAFVDLLIARGREPAVEILETRRRTWADRDEVLRHLRRQTWVEPGSAKDERLQWLVDESLVTNDDGSVELANAAPLTVGIAAWRPG